MTRRERETDVGSIAYQIARSLTQRPTVFMGMSLLWIWAWAVFQSSLARATAVDVRGGSLSLGYWDLIIWIAPLLSYALGFAVLGGLYFFRRFIPHGRAWRASVPILMIGGLWLTQFALGDAMHRQALVRVLYLAGSFAMGFGTAFLHVEWGRVSGIIGLRLTMIHGAAATAPAGLILAALTNVPREASVIILSVAALVSALLAFGITADSPLVQDREKQVTLRFSKKLAATAFVQGCSLGAIEILLENSGGDISLMLSMGGFICGAMLVLTVSMGFGQDFNRLLYSLGFPIMALGCLLITIFAPAVEVGGFVHAVGYRFVDVLIWALMAYVMNNHGQPAHWVTSIATLWLIAGQFCGVFACWLFTTELGFARGLEAGEATIACALLLCALLATNSQNMRTGWGMVSPAEGAQPLGAFDLCCQSLAHEFRLTAREAEVFSFVAKGYPRSYISDRLVLADGTVKSHIRRIYLKMDIHSRNDAIALVEKRLESYATDGER